MPQTTGFIVFLELGIPSFHWISELGISSLNDERFQIAFGKFVEVCEFFLMKRLSSY